MEKNDDKEIIRRCLEGDIERFAELVERYQKSLYNVAYRMLRDPDEAAEVTQAAFVKAYQNLAGYNPAFEFFSWIYRMVLNEAIDTLARQRRVAVLDEQLPSPTATPEGELLQKEVEQLVEAAIEQLSVTSRVVIVLRHFAHLTYNEIGFILEIPEKTVKSRLFEARRQLAELLSRRGMIAHD